MHRLLPYSIIFSITSGLAATGAYLVAPSKVISGADATKTSQTSHTSSDEDSEEEFKPKELTPRDHLIDNLTNMKVLEGTANASISFNNTNIGLEVNRLYLTDPINNLELYANVTISYNGESTDIEATYAQDTIYLSVLDTDIKLETSEFSRITEMLSTFDLPEIELPEALSNLSIEMLTEKLGEMTYKETENGYSFCFEIIEGNPIYFISDNDFNFTGLSVKNFSLEDIKLNLDASVQTKDKIDSFVEIPENATRKFQNFSDVLPLASHIANLVKQKQFALGITGLVIQDGQTRGTSINGSTQFDIDKKSGKAKLHVVEHEFDDLYKHDINLDISTEDVVFKYNNSIKGKLPFASLNSIIELIQGIAGNFEKEIPTTIEGIVSLLEGSVIGDVLNGKYESLLKKNIVKDITIENGLVALTIDKLVLGLEGDIRIAISFDNEKLLSISINNLKVLNLTISFEIELTTWDENYDCGIDRTCLEDYGDYSNFVPLVKGVKSLVEQNEYALTLEGNLVMNSNDEEIMFNGSTQFDLEKKFGDGELTISVPDSAFGIVNHSVKVGYEGTDVRFGYNNKLYGKFTSQSIKDTFSTLMQLVKSENSRVYEWFGQTIENMNETILMKIINGDYWLLFHDVLKDLVLENNCLKLTINGKILNFDGDICVKLGYSNEKITSIELVDFNAFGITLNLKVSLAEYSSNYERLPFLNMQGAPNYYDFSDINTLIKLGIDVIDLDYFHITGKINLNLDLVGVSLGNLFNIKDLPIDIKVFENNGDIGIRGKLSNVPTVGIINGLTIFSDAPKTIDFFYEDTYFYLVRTEKSKNLFGSETEVVERIRLSTEEFTDNLVYYLLGWGMGLERSELVWNKITDAISNPDPRTKPMDYASLLKNYSYENGAFSEGIYKWLLDINITELANNKDLRKLTATIYGNDFNLINPSTGDIVQKRFLTHLDAEFGLAAGLNDLFKMSLTASLDLNKNEYDTCFITYNDFNSDSRIKQYWNEFNSYIEAHNQDKLTMHY